jgi:hypothetical protein
MPQATLRLRGAVLAGLVLSQVSFARATSWEEVSAAKRALYTSVAVLANVLPFLPTVWAPRCLPPYVVCKLAFASISLLAAADQLAISGGADRAQTRAILQRGFGGDWFLTGEHIAGARTPQPLPDPPPPQETGEAHPSGGEGVEGGGSPEGGDWQPPPL